MNINDYNKVTDRIEPSERCRNEVLNMNKRHKKHIKLNKRGVAAIVAVAVAACGGTAAYAAEKLGVFSKLSDTLSGSYVDEHGNEWQKDKFEQYNFSKLDNEAKPFENPIPLDGNDISLTIESVYCDGSNLLIAVTGSLKDGNTNGYGYIPFSTVLKKDGEVITYARGSDILNQYSKLYLDEGTENSFTGTIQYTFGNSIKIREAEDIEFKLYDFKPNSNIYGIPDGIAGCDTPSLSDEFAFSVEVEPDISGIRHIENEFTDSEGYSVTVMDVSAAVMEIQSWTTPEEWAEHDTPYGKEHPDTKVGWIFYDGNGKKLDFIGLTGYYIKDDGRYASLVQSPDTDIVTIVYTDSGICDENGEPTVIHEMTIDLANKKVIE